MSVCRRARSPMSTQSQRFTAAHQRAAKAHNIILVRHNTRAGAVAYMMLSPLTFSLPQA